MPSKTEAQHEAMEAAAHGDSKLGIPKKVGEEYVDADGDHDGDKDKKGKKKYDAKKAEAEVHALRHTKEPEYVEDER